MTAHRRQTMINMMRRMRTIAMQIGATIQTSSMPAGAVAAVTGSNSIVESTINDSEYGLEVNFYSNINY